MGARRVMLIAGEASGDLLGAELVRELRAILKERGSEAEFFGAGGTRMLGAGVDLAFDMTAHAVVGLIEVLRNYGKFRRLFKRLLELAMKRRPDMIVCVDFSGFNRRFAHAVRQQVRKSGETWSPRIVQYVSPQVWASREGRALSMARDYDLLLAIFPFEKAWYAERTPEFRVEFVGHPMLDRHREWSSRVAQKPVKAGAPARVVLLPGSRVGELKRHVPAMLGAARRMAEKTAVQFQMVLPNDQLLAYARKLLTDWTGPTRIELRAQGLAQALFEADLAIASTGTVTMECAYFRAPTVALYKTSWSTFQIGKRIVKVKFLAMPNILAEKAIFPELIQSEATAENICREGLALLTDNARREAIRRELESIMGRLGEPGASRRAAEAIAALGGWT